MSRLLIAAFAALLLCAGAAFAEPTELTPEEKAYIARLEALSNDIRPIWGNVSLPKAKATLRLGPGYYFLDADDAKRVLTEAWSNPPDQVSDTLGMIFPAGKSFLDDSWGAVVTYHATFYVSDTDAQTADYDKMMLDMKSGEDEENRARQRDGFAPIHLIGWAQPPTYDPVRHDMVWAREMRFGQESDHTLNYDIRHLGRRGVLSLNMVSSMSHLADMRSVSAELARTAEFDPGSRYADYVQGDKLAGYGLTGLVAGGVGLAVAKKAGLLAVALLFLKKFAVLLLAPLAVLAGRVRQWFNRKNL